MEAQIVFRDRVLFNNRYPKDAESALRRPGMSLIVLEGKYRIVFKTMSNEWREWTPSGPYDFVVIKAEILVDKKKSQISTHTALAGLGPVDYAGTVRFFSSKSKSNRGKIKEWSNNSGHFIPSPDYAFQAGLPLELFRPYTGPC